VIVEFPEPDSLAEVLERAYALLVTSTRHDVHLHVTADSIVTWHAFRIDVVLSTPAVAPGCSEPVPSISLDPGEMAVPMFGGTTRVRGVDVTLVSDKAVLAPPLARGARYLIFAVRCNEALYDLPHGPADVFAVAPDGSLLPPRARTGLVLEVAEQKTVARLQALT
jgi:hypothetical protein